MIPKLNHRGFAPPLLTLLLLGALILGSLPASKLTPISQAAPLAWTSLDGPHGGPAQALAVSPTFATDSLVLAGGGRDFGHGTWAGRGIFRSDNGGYIWTPSGGPENGAVLDVAFSPQWATDGLALAGLWQGAWVTTDGGTNWQQLTGLSISNGGPAFVSAVGISPDFASDHTFLLGGAYGGVYRSTDAGATWTQAPSIGSARRLAFAPGTGAVALATASDGVWRSSDGGATWTLVAPASQTFDVAFRPLHDTAYATFADQVYRSTDGGATWTVYGSQTDAAYNALAVSTDGEGLFTAVGSTLYRYNAASGAFEALPADLAGQHILRLAVSPNFGLDHTVLAGTIDGVWVSHDGGMSFSLSDGFYPLAVRDMEYDPTTGQLYTATEVGVWRYSGQWQPLNAGIVGVGYSTIADVAVSPAFVSDHTLFAAWDSGVSIGGAIYRSTDGGLTWEQRAGAAFVSKVVLSPSFLSDHLAYAVADDRILESTDGGTNLDAAALLDRHQLAARFLAISPDFPTDQRLVAVGDSAYFSTDAGTTWHVAALPPPLTQGTTIRWFP